MRQAVVGLQIPHPGSSHGLVSISVGAASAMPDQDGDSQVIIKAADDALYYAKAAGRNCVVFCQDDEFVTYNPEEQETGTTNVIQLLASSGP